MDLSVIIPCHNLENYITPMLVSLNLQILEDAKIELIFICDNCTDKTEEKIRQFNFIPPYQNIIIKANKYNSSGLARNEGLNIAKGQIVVFFDGDDWLLDPRTLSTIVFVMKQGGFKILRFGFDAPKSFTVRDHLSMVWQYAYLRDFIGDLRFKDYPLNEDLYFNKRIIEKIQGSNRIPYLPNLVLYYYNFLRPGSTMQTYFERKQQGL